MSSHKTQHSSNLSKSADQSRHIRGGSSDISLSKTLSYLLRHGAAKEGLSLSSEGFASVTDILKHRNLSGKYSADDIRRVVSTNDKQRFSLREVDGKLEIRANQGHSLQTVKDLELVPLTNPESIGDVVHGTYFDWLESIKRVGLSRMNRNHIHFASGLPNSDKVISGARRDAEVFIYVDAKKAIRDGLTFYRSANGVILSPGNESGYLEPKYFLKICRRSGFSFEERDSVNEYFYSLGGIKDFYFDGGNIVYLYHDKKILTHVIHKNHVLSGKTLVISWSNPPENNPTNFSKPGPSAPGINVPAPNQKEQFKGSKVWVNPKQKMAQDQKDEKPLKQEGKESNSQALLEKVKVGKSFAEQLKILFDEILPNETELKTSQQQVKDDIQNSIREIYPQCQTHLYGSSLTGLAIKGSDVDVHVSNAFFESETELNCLRKVRQVLFKSKKFGDVLLISFARVPIIKCVHLQTKICCDLNVKSSMCLKNSGLIAYYVSLDPKFRQLFVAVKFWATENNLKKVNFFSSYALSMMLIFYLQQEPYKLPSVVDLQNTAPPVVVDSWNCGVRPVKEFDSPALRKATFLQLFRGFFDFYRHFDYFRYVICPFVGKPLKKTDFFNNATLPDSFKLYKKCGGFLNMNSTICVQDPFEHTRNVTSAVPAACVSRFTALCDMALQVFRMNGEPRFLHNILTILKLNMNYATFLLEPHSSLSLTKDTPDLLQKWFDSVKEVAHKIFKGILACKVTDMKCDPPPANAPVMNSAGYDCEGNCDVWENRVGILKNLFAEMEKQKKAMSDMEYEVATTDCISRYFSKPLNMSFTVQLYLLKNPCKVKVVIKNKAKCKVFLQLSQYLRIKLVNWVSLQGLTSSSTPSDGSEMIPNDNVTKTDADNVVVAGSNLQSDVNVNNSKGADVQSKSWPANSSAKAPPAKSSVAANIPVVKLERLKFTAAQAKALGRSKGAVKGKNKKAKTGAKTENQKPLQYAAEVVEGAQAYSEEKARRDYERAELEAGELVEQYDDEEDVPSDFFDDFSNQDFMDGLDIVDAWDDGCGLSKENEFAGMIQKPNDKHFTPEKKDNRQKPVRQDKVKKDARGKNAKETKRDKDKSDRRTDEKGPRAFSANERRARRSRSRSPTKRFRKSRSNSPKDKRRTNNQDEGRSNYQDQRRSDNQDQRRSDNLDQRRSNYQDQGRSTNQDQKRSDNQDQRRSNNQDQRRSRSRSRERRRSKEKAEDQRRSRSRSRERRRSKEKADARRDPEKTKRDIKRDKIKVAKDKEQKIVSDKLKFVETGLVPPGTEMDVDITSITAKTMQFLEDTEKVRRRSPSKERRSRRSSSKSKRKYSRSPDDARSFSGRKSNRDRSRDRSPVYKDQSPLPPRNRSPSYRQRNRETWVRRSESPGKQSHFDRRDRSGRKRSRSRDRDVSPYRSKYSRNEDTIAFRKSFLEEIRDKLNETLPSPHIPTMHIKNPYAQNPIVQPGARPVPVPVPAPPIPNTFLPPLPPQPEPMNMQTQQQYDQQFFIGNSFAAGPSPLPAPQPMAVNSPSNMIMPLIAATPGAQLHPAPYHTPLYHTSPSPSTPQPSFISPSQQQPSLPPPVRANLLTETNPGPVFPIQNKAATAQPGHSSAQNVTQPKKDVLFADKKISLSDFLTITSKAEVSTSNPEQLKKKIHVITRCHDAMRLIGDDRKFSGRLVVRTAAKNEEKSSEEDFQSPLRKRPAVRFRFTTPIKVTAEDKADPFSATIDRVLKKLGVITEVIDLDAVRDTRHIASGGHPDKNVPALKLKETIVASERVESMSKAPTPTKERPQGCADCRRRKLRVFSSVGTQCAADKQTFTIGTQVTEDDLTISRSAQKQSLASLTPAQLLAKDKEKDKEAAETKENPSKDRTPDKKADKPRITFSPPSTRPPFKRAFSSDFFDDDDSYYDRPRPPPPPPHDDLRNVLSKRGGGFFPGGPPLRNPHYPAHPFRPPPYEGDHPPPGGPPFRGGPPIRGEPDMYYDDFDEGYRQRPSPLLPLPPGMHPQQPGQPFGPPRFQGDFARPPFHPEFAGPLPRFPGPP